MQETTAHRQIQYPCIWHYRIIGFDKDTLRLAALENINKEFIHTPGKESSGGKYHSINLEIEVESQEERDLIFQALQKDSRIKFVL
ncbi:DUF493 domain-containing protein [Helicobacter sp. MIT 11-5569]|uniref:HP0495 family protein n=1 Tax=Helicobacter sp. MIT 11-5569 TaxID=1548151 RepID=UPI00051FB74C|nr:DUF493 domain-containing protein [Helicobacter sp. MIT 11-5569]TLD84082.1 DUF493 domain-containing protein [Helicobacter sp. MIT 11-5569]